MKHWERSLCKAITRLLDKPDSATHEKEKHVVKWERESFSAIARGSISSWTLTLIQSEESPLVLDAGRLAHEINARLKKIYPPDIAELYNAFDLVVRHFPACKIP